MTRTQVSFAGLLPASAASSRAAKGSSRKRDTRCELVLRRVLWRRGLRYRLDVADLPGRPDVAFTRVRLAVFCDGDFWHGRNLEARVSALANGHNAPYWVAKIRGNVARDARHDAALEALGWKVLRLWERDITRDPEAAADRVLDAVRSLGG